MAINPLEFNERIEFGGYNEGDYDDNGNAIKTFVVEFSRWFGYRTQSLNQQYTFLGNKVTDTKLIAIRHDAAVNDQMIARINGEDYDIILISSDDRAARETFDLITLQKVVKS